MLPKMQHLVKCVLNTKLSTVTEQHTASYLWPKFTNYHLRPHLHQDVGNEFCVANMQSSKKCMQTYWGSMNCVPCAC